MQAYGHIFQTDHFTMHNRNMILLVTIVPKSDDVEVSEFGWKICNASRAYTDLVRSVACTAVFFIVFD